MLVGDFLEAMAGYNEAESERVKSIAELVRTSTTLLLNIQLAKEDRLTPRELWPFSWDKQIPPNEETAVDIEEKKRMQQRMNDILNKIQPD
jgi:hypothetical protein